MWIYLSILSKYYGYFGFDKSKWFAPYYAEDFLESPIGVSVLRVNLILWISESMSFFLAVLLSSYLNYRMVDLNSSIIFRYSSEFLIW